MARFVYGLAALLALICGAALVVPGLLDWSAQKPAIAAALQRLTGQQVVIAGDVSVTLLPAPALALRDVRVPARAGSPQPDLARLKSLRLELALLPLLGGAIEPRAVTLEEPELAVSIARDGTGNWQAPRAGRAPESAPGEALAAAGDWDGLGLNDVTIRGGRLSYRDARTGAGIALANIDAELDTEAARGPMRGRGTAETGRSPLRFQFRLGEAQSGLSHLNALVDLPGLDMKAELTGDLATGARAGFDGHVRLEGNRAELLSTLVERPALRSLLAEAFGGRFTLEGDIAAEKDAASAVHLRLETDSNYATGSIAYRLGQEAGRSALTAAVTMQKIDLDRWLRAEPQESGGGQPAPGAGASHALDAPFALPRDLEAVVDLAVEAIVLNRSVVRDMRANLRLVDGELTVNQLTAGLPGGTRVSAFGFLAPAGGAPRFDGTVEAASDNLRGLLDWLSVDVSQVPAEMLRRWRARATATVTPELVRLDDLRMTVDVTLLRGSAALRTGGRPHLSLAVAGERLDLDTYLPEAPRPREGPPPAGAQAAGTPPPAVPAADSWRLAGFDATIAAKLDGVIYRGERIAGVDLAADFEGGRFTLHRLHAADAGGSEVRIAAEIGTTKVAGGMEATVQVSAARPRGVLGLFDIALPADLRVQGPLALEARLARGKEAGVWAVEGRLALGDAASTVGGTARLRADDAARPLFLELGADRVDLDFLLALLAAQAGAPDAQAVAAPRAAAPPGAAAWSDAAFPPSLLQLPAVELALKAGTLVYLGQRLENAELNVQTRRGSLEIKRLTGRLHGGALTLEGRLFETEAPGALSLAAVATLDGAGAGALLALREAAQMSDAAVGLKLSLEGKGRTPKALVASLTGKGRIWGQGGRIDGFDLARANDALAGRGEQVGLVDALAESGAGSTKISSFGGDFRIEAGALTTRSLRVQADGGTGEISGAFDLLRREIDAKLRLRFAAFPDAPPILAHVQGPPGDARVVVDFNALQAWLKGRAPRAKPASN